MATGMKIGVLLLPLRASQLAPVSVAAEALGYDSVWIGEHVVTPLTRKTPYPYAADDRQQGFEPAMPYYDPFAALAAIGMVTTRVKLATGVSVLPLTDPFRLARSVTTVDLLSNGRFCLGVGAGWLREEYDIMRADWAGRFRRLEEMIEVMRKLWTEESPAFDGELFSFPAVAFEPRPVQQPHPPLVFGGNSIGALRRAARLGDGWFGSGIEPSQLPEYLDRLIALRAEARPNDQRLEITVGVSTERCAEAIEQYAALGVDRVIVRPWKKGRDAIDELEALARDIVGDHLLPICDPIT
jgi:probable F420-dependent oxidoreductase